MSRVRHIGQEVMMKVARRIMLMVFVVAIAIGIALTAGAQQKTPKQTGWEYRDGANLTIGQLNALGAEGWELVITTQYDRNLYYILKRPKPL
jgi:hypothetical protein